MKESGLRSEPLSQIGKVRNKESGLHGRPLFHRGCSFRRRSGISVEPLFQESHVRATISLISLDMACLGVLPLLP